MRLLPIVIVAGVLSASPAAQRPARATAQATANDADFASFVKSATTRADFSSPLIDHLPRKSGVPIPKDILGYHVGAEKKLTYWADQQKWYRALEKAVPGRVKTEVIGKTEEGREIMVVYLTSDANLKSLEANRANLRRLADPRGLSPDEAKKIIARTKPHYHLSAGLHSGETSTSEMLIELAYRLAVSDEPYIQQIRDNVIVSMVPTTDIDGRDRYVDWYNAYKINEAYDGGENYGEPPYWGKYVFHDNNRDINYGVDTLRTYLKWYLNWVPPIWHDLHEAQTLLYTYSGGAPQNANWDPILYSDLMFFANYEVSRMTGYGMPGVWHFGFMDAWSPGYLAIAAQNHNGMLRMYEIFNQQGANTKKARFTGAQTTRQWYRPNPMTGDADWSIRDSINYSETAVLTALELTSKVPAMVVENFYKKSANAVNRGTAKAPYAFVIPAGQGDQTKVDRLANLLRVQAIEVQRATSEITVKEGTFAAGSYLVKLNQPYGPLAKTLLEKQVYPDAALATYDDSAWTMGLANNVDVRTIDDKAILDAPATLLTADVVTTGHLSGSSSAGGGVLAVKHNGSLNLVTLRYRLKDVTVRAAQESFKAGAEDYPAGSLFIPASDRARREIEALGLVATAMPEAPHIKTAIVDLPRLAIYTTWSNTEKVGWVRLAFDRFEIPFDLIHKDHVKQGNLRAKYDVIVMPHQGTSGKTIVYELPKLSKPLPYRKSDRFKSFGYYTETDDVRGGMGLEGAAEFQKFVDDGGTLVTLGIASTFPTDFGIAKGVDTQTLSPGFYGPGPYVQSEVLLPAHPVMYGYSQKNLPVRYAGGPLLQVGPPAEGPAASSTSPSTPQVIARFVGGESSVLSGVMRGADQIRNRPMIVDAPSGKGHALLFATNPIYRWQTFGEYEMVFNALMFWNDFPTALPAEPKPSGLGSPVLGQSLAGQQRTNPDPDIQMLVSRLDLQRYKATIESLSKFGDRRQGTKRNRDAIDWIEAQLKSYGCAEVSRLTYSYSASTSTSNDAQPETATAFKGAGPGGATVFGRGRRPVVNRDLMKQPDANIRELNREEPVDGERQEVYCTKVGTLHPDEGYIVGGHMDGHGVNQGANDDASGTALVMELARIFSDPNVRTDRSIRFVLWNNEETGHQGAAAYVKQRGPLQGIETPAGSERYPEPRWLGMIQHDMMLFDHGAPGPDGRVGPNQRREADVNIEFQTRSSKANDSMTLAFTLKGANEIYATDYPAAVGPHMTNTDSNDFMNVVASVSVREAERGSEIGGGWDPLGHTPGDVFAAYQDEDFRLGLNAAQTTLSAVAQLVGGRVSR